MADENSIEIIDEHEDEEKQISEDPINTSIQSEPDHAPTNNNNNNNQAPPAAFTFIPPVYDQPLPAYSSQPTIPSPKTHFHSRKKLNNISHNKQSQSYSPINNNNKNNKNNSFNSSPSNIHQPSKSHPNISPINKNNNNNNTSSHPMVKKLVDMGFPRHYVERAIKIFKRNFGSKPYRLEVLTEIILRLQRKDGTLKLEQKQEFEIVNPNKSLELNESTTSEIEDEIHKIHGNHNKNNSYIINNNKNNLILIEVIISASITKTVKENFCEVTIRMDQTLNDLKNLISSLNNSLNNNATREEYKFYHESGFIFNDNNITIKQCMNNISTIGYIFDDNRFTLKIGVFINIINRKKKRLSNKIKPLPRIIQNGSQKNNNNNVNGPVNGFNGRSRSKSTKLDIIKSKIEIETHKNFREIMTYIKDSPFWWKKMNEGICRVRKLTSRLKSIASLIMELCTLLEKFSLQCNKISTDVMKSWDDIENEFCGDVLSLNAQFFNLGDTINTLSTSSSMLSITLEKVIVDEFNTFCDDNLNNLLNSNKSLIAMKNEYEISLQSILHNKDNKSGETQLRCESLRKKYELKRYDHCIILNDIINRNRYDIILNLCAAFCAFETFFHIGYESSLSHKQFHHSIRIGLSEKDKKQKEYFDCIVSKNRSILLNVLNEGKDYNEYKKRIKKKPNKQPNKQPINFKYIQHEEKDKKDNKFKHVSLDYYDGYLWKQSSKSKKKWQKRWFVLTNGELEYFRNMEKYNKLQKNNNSISNSYNNLYNNISKTTKNSNKSSHKEYIGNTALSKVKKIINHDYKFVFEIITPSQRVYTLQAQTNNEYNEWFYVLDNQMSRLLLRKNTIDRFKRNKELEMKSYSINDQNNYIKMEKEKLKQEIFEKNKFCADCNAMSPEWCSINIGVIICVNCCGIHRGLGTHISKVRSLKLDDLSIINLKVINKLGPNNKLNSQLLESCQDNQEFYKKINYQTCKQSERSNFIKNKYTFKMFLDPSHINQQSNYNKNYNNYNNYNNINQQLWNAVANNEFFKVIYCLYYGADINHQYIKYNNSTVIHEAVQRNYTQMVQLLIHNEANVNVEDGNEQKPNQIAIKESLNNVDNTEIQSILKTAIY